MRCCSAKIDCPGTDSPVANLSSELPDQDRFIGIDFGWDWNVPPLGSNWITNSCLGTCVSNLSQLDADLCATRANLVCQIESWGTGGGGGGIDGGGGGGSSGPPLILDSHNGPPPTIYGNQIDTCTAQCPDGSFFNFTLLPDTFFALSQAQANAMAASTACRFAVAARICLGTLPDGCLGVSYLGLMTPSGGVVPFDYVITSGALPDGLNVAIAGNERTLVLQGTPSVAGDFTFTLKATDSLGHFAFKTFTVTILGITNLPLPKATKSQAYSEQLTAAGGTPPYTFALTSGQLPSGLTLSDTGLVSGTPDTIETQSFTITVSDSSP